MPDRIIRESICMSDTLNELSDFEERFWHRLIVNCDDFGRFDARPAVLKGRLFPLMDGKTKKDMADALNKLASVGLVKRYTVDGKPFLYVVNWSKYQRPRAKKSKFPAPDNTCCQMSANVAVFENESDMRYAICENEDENGTPAVGTADASGQSSVGSAVAFFRDRVNPMAAMRTLELLADFERDLGSEVCIRAMMVALDAGKPNWSYIQGILQNKRQEGIRSLAAWDAHEAQRKGQGASQTKSWADLAREMEEGA